MSYHRLIAILKAAPLELTDGMSTDKWEEIAPSRVHLDDLEFTQDQLYLESVLDPDPEGYVGDEYPHVVEHDGTLYVDDGHHRLANRKVRGRKTALARVLSR